MSPSEFIDGVGLDVGSTTAKLIVARRGAVVLREYQRHEGRCRDVAAALLSKAEARLGALGSRFITGSAGAELADVLNARYVQEVHAVATAVRASFPRARTVVELGGQDAKMIHLDAGSGIETEMNERCAAGTGATLDRCLFRLGLTETELQTLLPGDEIPSVSAKCGVFAETDAVGLVKAGTPVRLVVPALLDAIVRGNLAVLARGRPLAPQVILLGGPHAFAPALTSLWWKHLSRRWADHGVTSGDANDVLVPPNAQYFAAEGALRSAETLARLGRPRRLRLAAVGARRVDGAPLLRHGERPDRRLWLDPPPVSNSDGPLHLGIDAGSTTVKAAVLDAAGSLVATEYRRATSDPMEDAQRLLEALRTRLGSRGARIASLGVTGYAADVLGPALGADATPVETLAHAGAARRYVPDADVVCDVGGQDIKLLLLDGEDVRGFHLSNQCAAGNGVLLEAAARDLGVPIERYADTAFEARRAPTFSVGCAVFLDTERVTAQRDGYSAAEILAAFAAVLPRNIWENTVGIQSLADLGHVFVLSGGVQRNAAAVAAQADYIRARHPGARVVVHPFPGEAGAIGAALAAQEVLRGASRFIGLDAASRLKWTVRNNASTRCGRCPSNCSRSFLSNERGQQVITGHGCARGATEEAPRLPAGARTREARNLLRTEARRLFARSVPVKPVSRAAAGLRIAIPRVLSLYRSGPLFTHYFESIGVERRNIITGGFTSEALWRRAAGRGTVDGCFPAKVVQAHVADLLARRVEQPFDVLFLPAMTHALSPVTGGRDTASCITVAGTPLVSQAIFGGDTQLVSPVLTLTAPALFRAQLLDAVRRFVPGLTEAEHLTAIAQAVTAQRAFEQRLEEDGRRVLGDATEQRRCAIVLLGRPYHVDPGLHHDLGSELQSLGRTTLSVRALPKEGAPLDLGDDLTFLTNVGETEKMFAARTIGAHPYLVGIELSSFKCGMDAPIYSSVATEARRSGKPFLPLHDIDESRPVGSLRLRLRTFLHAVERWEARA